MTERERLIELLEEGHRKHLFYDQIADHLLANGVIVPPCKVGQVVYPLNADPRFRAFVESVEQTTNGFNFEWVQYDVGVDCTETWDAERFGIEDIGKTVFLDEAEYLKALEERSEQ